MSEAEVLQGCLQLLRKHPKVAFCWRAGVVRRRSYLFGLRGCSDILGVLKGTGRLLAVETKAPGKEASDEQHEFLQSVVKAGGAACCVDDPEKLAKFLAGI